MSGPEPHEDHSKAVGKEPESRSDARAQLVAVRDKTNQIRKKAREHVPNSEMWLVNMSRAAILTLHEATLLDEMGKTLTTVDEARNVRLKAVEELEIYATQLTRMVNRDTGSTQLRKQRNVIYQEMARAYTALGWSQQASKYYALTKPD